MACKHQHMHFENGGLHLVCEDCGSVYVCVGKCPARTMQDFNARALGLFEGDKRSDPMSLPVAKSSKKTN